MASTLPANVAYGKVIGRFLYADGDGSDIDNTPDGVAAVGTVTFTPSVSRITNTAAAPPVSIFPRPVVCTINADGFLVDATDTVGVWLIATDNPDLNPTDWTYRVTIVLAGVKTPQNFDIEVPTDDTIDLTIVAPVSSSGGTTSLIGPPGESAYDAAVARHGFVGTEAEWLASLEGPPGGAGPTGDLSTWGIKPTLYINPTTGVWPARTLPSGYSGTTVVWDSREYAGSYQPA